MQTYVRKLLIYILDQESSKKTLFRWRGHISVLCIVEGTHILIKKTNLFYLIRCFTCEKSLNQIAKNLYPIFTYLHLQNQKATQKNIVESYLKMLEALKIFLTKVDFSLKEIPNQNDQINSIHQGNLLNSKFSTQEIKDCFHESYQLVKKHIDISYQSIDQFEKGFSQSFEDYYARVGRLLPNKELTYIFFTQLYQSNIQKFGLHKVMLIFYQPYLINRYEGIALEHYCLKQEYLSKLATEYGQSEKLAEILNKQMDQLIKFKEEERRFLQKMREMQSYFDSEEFISQQFQLFKGNNISKIDRSSSPVLPNFFINLYVADSLNEMSKVNFLDEVKDRAQQFIKTIKEIPDDDKYMLDTLKGIQELQSTPYLPISIISNSRTNHEAIIQKILCSQREIATNFFDENNSKTYEGDLIGYLERKEVNSINLKVMIITTPGLDELPSLKKQQEEMRSLENLKMNIKDFKKVNGDMKGYSKQIVQGPGQQEEKSQLFTIFQLMKKSLMCYYMIHQSNTIYVVLQDNQQDFSLYQQIMLICCNFLVSEDMNKEINFIHYYPNISDVKSKHAETQFEKIKAKYNLQDTASDFKNERFMKFKQNKDIYGSDYRKKIKKQINFHHMMLFGDFESKYNQQLFKQMRKEIDDTKCEEIVPNLIERNFRNDIFQFLTHFFQACDKKQEQEEEKFFEFKERQIIDKIEDDKSDCSRDENVDKFQEWKDLIFYPFSFLTPNPIEQQQ